MSKHIIKKKFNSYLYKNFVKNKRKKTSKFLYKFFLKKKLIKLIKNDTNIDLFLKKIFSILIYTGKKIKIIKIYLNWIRFLKFLFIKKFKIKKVKKKKLLYFSMYKFIFVNRMCKIICPKIGFQGFFQKAVLTKLPRISKFKYKDKTYDIVSSWLKKAVSSRKEKTFILKFYSELFDINLKKGSTYKQKIEYYKTLYNNKKFYKYSKWI